MMGLWICRVPALRHLDPDARILSAPDLWAACLTSRATSGSMTLQLKNIDDVVLFVEQG
jgi:hypothetical protein